ncbi:MAG: hypothetical protein CL868_16305 [Cytophagaceae bacterium]|nr:hypothetical protein [Cytophagaceae bacterium]|tara:strand:- start:6047 stop:6490 length:444 start_codon:yes stop_codon:yes gene_type:complete
MKLPIFITMQEQPGLFTQIGHRIQEGGPFAMSTIIFCFIIMIALSVVAFINLKKNPARTAKYKMLINQIVLLALVIGLFNSILGLIQAFDSIEATGGGEPALVAGGIKITLLSPIFGGFVFIAGRIVTFILTWLSQETNTDIVKDLK